MKKVSGWELDGGYVVVHKRGDENAAETLIVEFERLQRENKLLRKACERLAPWMFAALSDDKVCDEMKKDIQSWFDTLTREGGE